MSDALHCIASLVKISNEFDHISVGYVQKTMQKQPKIVLLAGMKAFEISKLQELQIIRYKRNLAHICTIGTRNIPNNEGVNEWVDGGWGATKKPPENAMKLRESRL